MLGAAAPCVGICTSACHGAATSIRLTVQIVPSLPPVTNYATADPAAALRTALFRARVPPLGHALYTFAAVPDETVEQPAEAPEHTAATPAATPAPAPAGSAVTIENEALSLTFDATGALASITNKAAKLTTPLTQACSYCRGSMCDGAATLLDMRLQAFGTYKPR